MIEFQNMRVEGDSIVFEVVNKDFNAECELYIRQLIGTAFARAAHEAIAKEVQAQIEGIPGPEPIGLLSARGKR